MPSQTNPRSSWKVGIVNNQKDILSQESIRNKEIDRMEVSDVIDNKVMQQILLKRRPLLSSLSMLIQAWKAPMLGGFC